MFRRLVRTLKAWIGYFISFAEDPEVLLQESIEEKRNLLPRLNQVLVISRSAVLHLEVEREQLELKVRQLLNSIKAEVTAEVQESAVALELLRQELAVNAEALMVARNAFENTQFRVERIKTQLRAAIEESRRAIQELKRAEVMRSALSAIKDLETLSSKTGKYFDEIALRISEAQATVEVAVGETNMERIHAERKIQQLRTQNVLMDFEEEMERPPGAANYSGGSARVATEKIVAGDRNIESTESKARQLRAQISPSKFEEEMGRCPVQEAR